MNCPKCGKELTLQPSVAVDYFKANCYSQIEVITRKKPTTKPHGFIGFVKKEEK